MATFKVTPSDLESLAQRLSSLLGELESAAAHVSSSASAAAQNAELESAIDGFVRDWSHSVLNLRTKLTEISERLSGAGDAYEQAETDIIQHLAH